MRRRRAPEIIAGRVNANGTVAMGDNFQVIKGGTGVYTVYFASGFRLISATVTAGAGYGVTSFSERTITFNFGTVASPSTPQDTGFSFIAVGMQT